MDSTEAQLIQRTERVLYTWFRRARRAADDRQWAAWVGRKRDKSGGVHFVRPNALRALSHDAPGGSGGLQKQTLFSFLQGRTPEPILRRYVEDCFGASMLTPGQRSEAERTLCTGVHKNCRLHFTRGLCGRGLLWNTGSIFPYPRHCSRIFFRWSVCIASGESLPASTSLIASVWSFVSCSVPVPSSR